MEKRREREREIERNGRYITQMADRTDARIHQHTHTQTNGWMATHPKCLELVNFCNFCRALSSWAFALVAVACCELRVLRFILCFIWVLTVATTMGSWHLLAQLGQKLQDLFLAFLAFLAFSLRSFYTCFLFLFICTLFCFGFCEMPLAFGPFSNCLRFVLFEPWN